MVCMMALDDRVLTHNGIYLFLKIVYKFGSYILTVNKLARVINIL